MASAPYPKLRSDVIIKKQVLGGETSYLIKIKETQEYLRFREMEWAILEQLDGQTSFEQVAAGFNRKFPQAGVDAGQVEDFIALLKSKGVLERTAAERSIVILEKLQAQRKKQAEQSQGQDVFYLTVATVNPERFYKAVYPYLRWIWTPAFVAATLLLFAAAATVLVMNWTVVREGMLAFWSFENKTVADIVMLFCILAVIVAIHESAHALTCMNFGGEVNELGFMFIFFMPAFYANVSDAHLFDKQWHKYWVTLAGGYSELIICSFAVFTWSLTSPDSFLHNLAYTTMVFAGISTIVFNYNPLIKLDGYYLLSDVLQVSNLRENATKYIVYTLRTRLFRVAGEPPLGLTPRKRRIFAIYGTLSTLYITLVVTIFILFLFNFFTRTFLEAGVFLGFFAAYMILRKRLNKLMKFSRFVYLDKKELFRQKAAVRRWAAAAALLLLVLLLFPFPHAVSGRAVLEPARRQAVRAEAPGFVAEAFDQPGRAVAAGEVLARLRNDELSARRRLAERQWERLLAEAAAARSAARLDEYHAALGAARQAAQELAELRRQEGLLEIRAPFDGAILSSRLQDLLHRHVEPGEVLMEFGAVESMRARIQVTEFNWRELAEGHPVKLKVAALPAETFTGAVRRRAMASVETYDPAGRTTEMVRAATVAPGALAGSPFSHLEVWIEIPNPQGRLRPGMTGTAKIVPDRHSLAARLYRAARDLVRTRLWW